LDRVSEYADAASPARVQQHDSGLKGQAHRSTAPALHRGDPRCARERRGLRHHRHQHLVTHAHPTGQTQAFMKMAPTARLKRSPPTSMPSCTARSLDHGCRQRRWTASGRSREGSWRHPQIGHRRPGAGTAIKLARVHNPTENVYITKGKSGRALSHRSHTYPMGVRSSATYKPDDFMKPPAYDRSYPPVKP